MTSYGEATELSMLILLLDKYITAEGNIDKLEPKAYIPNLLNKIINLIYDLKVTWEIYSTPSCEISSNLDIVESLIHDASNLMIKHKVDLTKLLKQGR